MKTTKKRERDVRLLLIFQKRKFRIGFTQQQKQHWNPNKTQNNSICLHLQHNRQNTGDWINSNWKPFLRLCASTIPQTACNSFSSTFSRVFYSDCVLKLGRNQGVESGAALAHLGRSEFIWAILNSVFSSHQNIFLSICFFFKGLPFWNCGKPKALFWKHLGSRNFFLFYALEETEEIAQALLVLRIIER